MHCFDELNKHKDSKIA